MERLKTWDEVEQAIQKCTTQDEMDSIIQTNIELCYANEFRYKYISFFQRKKIINDQK